jgi:signal transduction histidine kinase
MRAARRGRSVPGMALSAPTTRGIALSIVMTTFFVVVTPHAVAGDEGARALDALAYVLLVGAGLSLALRGAQPYAGYALALGCVTAYVLRGYGGGPIYVAAFLALVSVVIVSERRVWIPCAAAGALALSVAAVINDGPSWSTAVFATIWLAGAGLVGEAVRARRGQEAALAARAAEAERTRDEEARRRGAEERLRMAREVHDVVGHSLAVISLQAGVAGHLLQTRPQQAREAVAAIRKVAGEALDDLRAELGLLRDADGAPPAPAPVAGLEAVPGLVASLRQAGVQVELDDAAAGNGEAPLPEAVSAAGYRIIREALTNVARHAGAGSRAHVRIARGDDAVEVEVVDDGAGPSGAEGSGIAGMRERAAALGGRLEAGAADGGGFRVWASLPAHEPTTT